MDIQQLEIVFNRAISMSPEERSRILDQEFGVGTESRGLVEEMIADWNQADQFFDKLQRQLSDEHDYTRQQIDRYLVGELIGRGGMGRVYDAQRSDGLYDQSVAIKVIRSGLLHSKQQVERERQILADLNHPNIAKIFDAGFTDNGEAYLVMEKVSGLPLDKFYQRTKPDLSQRIEIFRQICDAIRCAHQNLIIHSDLKPSNILVDESGTVKLLDFGISSLLTENQSGKGFLTPDFCSPEQINGDPVNTSTDIYQLAIVFYLLLTGESLFKKNTGSQVDLKSRVPVIAKDKIPGDAYIRRDLAGIIEKAIHRQAEQRYRSVDNFYQDIELAVGYFPLSNLPGHPSRRISKFFRRNRLVTTIAASVLILILALSSFYTFRINHERKLAQQEAEHAEKAKSFLFNIIDLSDPYSDFGPDVSVKEMLNMAREMIDPEFSDQPELKAELYSRLGQIYANYKQHEEGAETLIIARDLNENLYGLDCAQNIPVLASLSMLYNRYNDTLSYQYGREAMRLARKHHGKRSVELARIITNFSTNRLALTEERDSLCIIGLEIAKEAPGDNRLLEAEILHNCSSWRGSLPGDGLKHKERALQLVTEVKGRDHPLVGEILNDLSLKYESVNLEKAFELNKEAYEISVKNLGSHHLNTLSILNNLAVTSRQLNDYEQALVLHRQVYDSLLRYHKSHLRNIAYAAYGLGKSYYHLGRLGEAIHFVEMARNNLVDYYGQDALGLVYITETDLINMSLESRKLKKAREYLEILDRKVINNPEAPVDKKKKVAAYWKRYFELQDQAIPKYLLTFMD